MSNASEEEERLRRMVTGARAVKVRSGGFGLGDAIAVVAKPIGRAIGLPPDCVPCAERQRALNDAGHQALDAVANAGRNVVQRVRRISLRPQR
jgi:hypothetical protein